MQTVLVIADSSQQQERLRTALNLGEDVRIAAANLKQINPKNLKTLRQFDLIVMEDISLDKGRTMMDYLLASLKRTGLPIVLLPPLGKALETPQEPLVLNLTDESIAQPGIAALINKVRVQYYASIEQVLFDDSSASADMWLTSSADSDSRQQGLSSADVSLPLLQSESSQHQASKSSKVASALTAINRVSNQLREPLSNINLAIHMLSQVRSIEDRDRYIQLLREEYQRELQLVNELEMLQSSLESIL
jgi:hypothetical protein